MEMNRFPARAELGTVWMAVLGIVIGGFASSRDAQASGLPLDPSQFANLANLLDPLLVSSAIRSVGGIADHRPYDPATVPIERGSGIELSVEVSLIKVPPDFIAALGRAGISDPTSIPPALPIPRLQLRKSLGDSASLGLSAISYKNYKIYGGDLKVVLSQPEEGVSWGARITYASAELGFVKTRTVSPQLLLSKPLEFAEPYMGAGWQIINGSLNLDVNVLGTRFQASKDASMNSFFAFMGLMIRPAPMGLLLVMEGSYNQGGTATLGGRVGLAF